MGSSNQFKTDSCTSITPLWLNPMTWYFLSWWKLVPTMNKFDISNLISLSCYQSPHLWHLAFKKSPIKKGFKGKTLTAFELFKKTHGTVMLFYPQPKLTWQIVYAFVGYEAITDILFETSTNFVNSSCENKKALSSLYHKKYFW